MMCDYREALQMSDAAQHYSPILWPWKMYGAENAASGQRTERMLAFTLSFFPYD